MRSIRELERDDVPSRTTRFTLRDIAVGFFLACLWLALGSQLGLTGILLGGYLSALFLGIYLRRSKWKAAGACGLAVFLLTYPLAWWRYGTLEQIDSARCDDIVAPICLTEFNRAANNHLLQYGAAPYRKEDLRSDVDFLHWLITERWGEARFVPSDSGLKVVFLGRDGRPGGVGFDADLSLENFEQVRRSHVPFHQFLDCERISFVNSSAMLVSVIAFVLGLTQVGPARSRTVWVVKTVLYSIAAALLSAIAAGISFR